MSNLFLLHRALGDNILATGIIDQYKDSPSVIVTTPQVAPFFEDLPNLERVIQISTKPWKKHWIEGWQATRGTVWDTIIDVRGTFIPRLLSAHKKHIWKRSRQKMHKVLLNSLAHGSQVPLSPTIWLSEERLARTKPSRPTLAVAPIPSWVGKQWSMENFIKLLTIFCQTYPDAQVAVFAAPHERDRVVPLLNALPKDQCVDTIGGHLLDSAALIQWSRVFLGNDSGLMHLSAAVKTSTIALFGPSDERIFGPWSSEASSPHRVVRGEPFTREVPQKAWDTKCYMTAITVPLVWEVLQERWEASTATNIKAASR